MREMSVRKRNLLLKRARRLPEDPFRTPPDKCAAITELRSRPLPPEPPFVEQDDRRQKTIRSELARLEPGGGFHDPMPQRKIGIF
jgi:hypothetical protein